MRFWSIVLVMALASTTVARAADDYPYLGRVTGNDVRVRSGPSLNHRVLDRLNHEGKVVVDGVVGEWMKVRVPGGVPGWVREDLLEIRGSEAIVVKTRVLIRPTAGQDYLPLEGRLEQNEKLRVLGKKKAPGEDLAWIRVVVPDRIPVFISAAYIEKLPGVVPSDLEKLSSERRTKLIADAKPAVAAKTVASRDDALRARIRKAEKALGRLGEEPDPTAAVDGLKRELQQVLAEADFAVTKVEAASAYKDILLFEKRRELAAARAEARLTEEELREAIRKADRKYQNEIKVLAQRAPVREMKFACIGWVHYRKGAWVIQKGGIPLYVLTSKLFDLQDFVGKKVGVHGPVIGEDPARGVCVIDVEAVEIFTE
jgi:Bacterial SH3 domain